MLHMLQWFAHLCCKHMSQCLMCFSDVCCKSYLDVAYVSHIYCKCFIWMLHMCLQWFSSVFTCLCKCFFVYKFQVFHLYVASIASRCFKSRSGVAHRMRVRSRRGSLGERSKRRHNRRRPSSEGPHRRHEMETQIILQL
jgi:hypothetical protein